MFSISSLFNLPLSLVIRLDRVCIFQTFDAVFSKDLFSDYLFSSVTPKYVMINICEDQISPDSQLSFTDSTENAKKK